MAELIHEIVVDARPSTILPFLVDPAKHSRVDGDRANSTLGPGVCTGSTSEAGTGRRAGSWRSSRTRRWCSPSGGTSPTIPSRPDRRR